MCRAAAAAAAAAVASVPARPVKALALPAVTSRARAPPPLSAARHQSTAEDAVFERVSTPATLVPGATSTSSKSRRLR